tara:strand:+ start:1342 stop:2640 length:1299 start_codon:yes stop_codon:yes gene_type:complete
MSILHILATWSKDMKIESIETYVVDAGWRPWQFTEIKTDSGITGFGEMSDGRNPWGIVGAVEDFKPLLLGKDPLNIQSIYWDLQRMAIQSKGGIASKAIAGIELALWDIKGKHHGIPVYELFGGKLRDTQKIYWSHCGTSRARSYGLLGVSPLNTRQDIVNLGKEVADKGYTSLKTNIIVRPDSPLSHPPKNTYVFFGGFGGGNGSTDQGLEYTTENQTFVNYELLDVIEDHISALQEGSKGKVTIGLDLNFNFKPQAAKKICSTLEKYNMMWVEIDMYEPEGLKEIKDSTSIPITSGENLLGITDYRPYFNLRSMDVAMIDIPWQGFGNSRDVAALAASHQINIAPHNYYSHLSTMISLNLCANVPNVRIMEIDIDDVPWKDEMIGGPLNIKKGVVDIPTAPGWGVDIDTKVLTEHAWQKGKGPGYTNKMK